MNPNKEMKKLLEEIEVLRAQFLDAKLTQNRICNFNREVNHETQHHNNRA